MRISDWSSDVCSSDLVAAGDKEDVDRAVKAARAAFEDGRWSRLAPAGRKKVMLRWAELIEQHTTELALLETLDMGKPIGDSSRIDIPAVANCSRWYAEIGRASCRESVGK